MTIEFPSPVAQYQRLAPAHWSWKPAKYVAAINARTLPEDTPEDFELEYIDIASVRSDGSIAITSTLTFGAAPSRARRLVSPRDSIVSTVRTYLRAIARIPADAPANLVCSTGFAVLHAGEDMDPDYLFWWLRSVPFVEEVVARSVGVGYPAISPFELGRIPVPAPPMDEQVQIVSYLDREIARLDELIQRVGAKASGIENGNGDQGVMSGRPRSLHFLLDEHRQALITGAVTGQVPISRPA